MTDRVSVIRAARLVEEWVAWWLTHHKERWPVPPRTLRGCNVDLGIYDAYDDLDEETKQQLPRFWKLMNALLRKKSPPNDNFFVHVVQVTPAIDKPLFAHIKWSSGRTEEASLFQVAYGEVASHLDDMIYDDEMLTRDDEKKLAFASGMHPRLGQNSSLRRAEQHALYAPEPLQMTLEMLGVKEIPEYRGWHPRYFQSAKSLEATLSNIERVKAARKRLAVKRSMGEAVPDPRVIEERRRSAAEALHRRQTVPAAERGLSEPQEDENEDILE